MTIQVIKERWCVCKPVRLSDVNMQAAPLFLAVTDDEISLICQQGYEPEHCFAKQTDWRALKVVGPLDFSLTGVMACISTALANAGIALLALSTYDTDYILVKEERLACAIQALADKGFERIM